MAPGSGTGPPPEKPGSAKKLTDRFRQRAEALRRGPDSPPFLTALAECRSQWDATFPEFAIGTPGPGPDRELRLGEDAPFPPTLLAAIDKAHQQTPDQVPLAEEPARARTLIAAAAWPNSVLGLCADWWPSRYYPNWHGPYGHPAMRFVGGCLVWEPSSIQIEWIRPISRKALIRRTLHDPTDPNRDNPELAFWRTRYETLVTALAAAAEFDDGAVSPDRLATIDEGALQQALQAKREASKRQAKRHPWRSASRHLPPPFRFLLLPPGFSATDLREVEGHILQELHEADGVENIPLAQDARDLRTAGHSIAGIARQLGIDRRTVQGWLAKGGPPTASDL